MFSHFANMAGFWVLACIPVVLLIHFLQQRARRLRVSTLFLMDALPPESSTGRVLDRIRSSRSLWLQLLAVLLCAWVLSEPKFVRENSSQTVAIVLDDSATMRVFQEEARQAARALIRDYDGRTLQTHWVVMGTSSRNELLYRGAEAEQAREAVGRWSPGSGTHDLTKALRVASSLTESQGFSWLITDAREKCPLNQAAIGVGAPLENVGFVGMVPSSEGALQGWRIAIRNHGRQPQAREWSVSVDGVELGKRTASLEAGGMSEFFVPMPEGGKRMVLALSNDRFDLDDYLPLCREEPRKLTVSVEVKGRAGEFFRKLCASMEGVEISGSDEAALRIVPFSGMEGDPVAFWRESASRQREGEEKDKAEGKIPDFLTISQAATEGISLSRQPIVPERLAFLDGLSWNGLLGTGSVIKEVPSSAQVLLWQGSSGLVWRDGDSLVLNWVWESSNADRLPSFVLLMRRYIQEIQEKQEGSFTENVPLNSKLKLVKADRMRWTPVAGKDSANREAVEFSLAVPYHAPLEPGFFSVYESGGEVMQGAAYFDDARQGDFSSCSRFLVDLPASVQERREQQALPDPYVPLWIVFIILALIGSWWPARRKTA